MSGIEELCRRIFGRFQNLNLLTLLVDLEKGRVSAIAWVDGNRFLCPLAHGWSTNQPGAENARLYANVGCQDDEGMRFVRWWWSGWNPYKRGQELLGVIRSLWEERLADALAVQEITAPEEVLV